jgi:hypothetical protein
MVQLRCKEFYEIYPTWCHRTQSFPALPGLHDLRRAGTRAASVDVSRPWKSHTCRMRLWGLIDICFGCRATREISPAPRAGCGFQNQICPGGMAKIRRPARAHQFVGAHQLLRSWQKSPTPLDVRASKGTALRNSSDFSPRPAANRAQRIQALAHRFNR